MHKKEHNKPNNAFTHKAIQILRSAKKVRFIHSTQIDRLNELLLGY